MFSFLIPLLEGFQVVMAVVASIVFLGLAGLTLASSAAALTVTTPLFIIFSPILVPATIATAVLTSGFTAGGILGAMAVALIRRRMGVKPTAEGTSSTPSVQLKLPIYGGYRGSWGGKTFSGTFGKPFSGNIPGWLKGIPAAAGGSNPASGGKTFSGTFGNPFSGNIPGWLKGIPTAAGGSNPASGGAAPAAGAAAPATPAAGAAAPAAGSTPPTW